MTKLKNIMLILILFLFFSCAKKDNNNVKEDKHYLSDYLEKNDKLWGDLGETLEIMTDQILTNKKDINKLKERIELLEQQLENRKP
jgi:polyhydroxyalkanoate synthesis regulator phasin